MSSRHLEELNQVLGWGIMIRYVDLRIYWFCDHGGPNGHEMVRDEHKGLKLEYEVDRIEENEPLKKTYMTTVIY